MPSPTDKEKRVAAEDSKIEPPDGEAKPADSPPPAPATPARREIGGPKGREPTRYQDWERGGRCIDF